MTPDTPNFHIGERVWHKAGDDLSGIVLAIASYESHIEYLISWGDNSRCLEPGGILSKERVAVGEI